MMTFLKMGTTVVIASFEAFKTLWWWSVKFEPAFSVQGYSLLAMARLVHTSTIRVLWINGVGEERTPIHGVAGCGWRK